MALPLFAVTLFTSAFILFLVQPMVGKMILPKLGGTPQVWNTCMVFFQSTLLAGYAYTHFSSTRFSLKRQVTIHSILLFIPLILWFIFKPFDFSGTPPFGENPILWALWVLTIAAGCPFFVVSTTAPLLQKWFRHTGHAASHDPYFLYIASNVGSMIGLLAYPVIFEPYMGLTSQSWTWVVLFGVFLVLVLVCGKMTWDSPPLVEAPQPPPVPEPAVAPVPAPAPVPAKSVSTGITKKKFGKGKPPVVHTPAPAAVDLSVDEVEIRTGAVTPWRRLRWTLLSAAPVSLMLGTVNYICTDVTPNPLIWVVFLALYLLTFILVFSRWPVVWIAKPHRFLVLLQPLFVLIMCILIFRQFQTHLDLLNLRISGAILHITLGTLAFFCTALVCHGELAKDRPDPKHLTEYFLWMSFGGMLGGMFNGLAAPLLFKSVTEFPLAIILGCLLRAQLRGATWTEKACENWFPNLVGYFRKMGDDLAKSYKKKEPHTGYVFSFGLDLLLPALLYLLTILFIFTFGRLDLGSSLSGFLKMMGLGEPDWLADKTFQFLSMFLPIVICFMFHKRPIRLGLGVAAILGIQMMLDYDRGSYVYHDRSYYGVLRVQRSGEYVGGGRRYKFGDLNETTQLTHGSTLHGNNYQKVISADPEAKRGDNNYVDPDLYRRYPTTYYHPYGPAGAVMHKYDWFDDRGYGDVREYGPKDQKLKLKDLLGELMDEFGKIDTLLYYSNKENNTKEKRDAALAKVQEKWFTLCCFKGEKDLEGKPLLMPDGKPFPEGKLRTWLREWGTNRSDTRMPASLVGLGLADVGMGGVPLQSLVGTWSEPAYATIGLGTGTMAAYSRYLQHMHFYEIDNQIRKLNLPEDGSEPFFNYLKDGLETRNACIQVRMGDARLRMGLPYTPYWDGEEALAEAPGALVDETPGAKYRTRNNNPSHVPAKERNGAAKGGGPDNFYHMMVVDAFSSDAIPAHLITREAIEMYMSKLTPDGILCVHTSNRHVALVPVVEVVARFTTFPNLKVRLEDVPDGARITNVTAGGADDAQLKAEDVIVWAGDREVRSVKAFKKALDPFKDGDILSVKVKRGNETLEKKLKLQGLFARKGHSLAPYGEPPVSGHYSPIMPGDSSSEWVMVSRTKDVIDDLRPETYQVEMKATGGKWSLGVSVNGGKVETASDLAFNITPDNLQTELQKLSNIGAKNITVEGTAGSLYILTPAATHVLDLTLTTSSLTGGTATNSKTRDPNNYRSMLGLATPPFYKKAIKLRYRNQDAADKSFNYWLWPEESKSLGELTLSYPWTDEYYNLFSVFRWSEGWSGAQWGVFLVLMMFVVGVGVVLFFVANKKEAPGR